MCCWQVGQEEPTRFSVPVVLLCYLVAVIVLINLLSAPRPTASHVPTVHGCSFILHLAVRPVATVSNSPP